LLSPHNERAQPAACATGDPGALDGIRVLDLTDGALQYCGKLLAQAGAEVTLVEPPGGCATRRSGPFIDDRVHIEHSLPFAYFNQGKRGVCIDFDSPEGQPLLHELARNADLLIHSYSRQGSGQAGVDAQTLQRINPRLVVTSITGFGVSGPYANYQTTI
jgi:benzylsuccinate CoA-transferase BbsE subunit